MLTQLGLLEQTFTDPSSPSLLMETLIHRWGTCQAAYVVIASTKMVEATHLGIAEKVCYPWDSGGGWGCNCSDGQIGPHPASSGAG